MQLSNLEITLPVMIPSFRMALGLSAAPRVAFVGSGGKSTALFYLAREYPPPVIVTATSHLEIFQAKQADHHFHYDNSLGWDGKLPLDISGLTLFSGPKNNRSVAGLEVGPLHQVLSLADKYNAPLLIEADGSRRHPVKAPAEYEPPIPDFVDTVVVTVGLSALGQPCTTEWVHRPEIYADLAGLQIGDEIKLKAMERVLRHPSGGLKNIPPRARRVALLNQVDTAQLHDQTTELAERLLPTYHAIIIASLKNNMVNSRPLKAFYK